LPAQVLRCVARPGDQRNSQQASQGHEGSGKGHANALHRIELLLYAARKICQEPWARAVFQSRSASFAACASVAPRQNVEAITDVPFEGVLESPAMGVKYYTHFVLTGEAAEGKDQEFSGVV